MRLVKQIQLFFQEGSSDKIYEIDLCESGTNEFLVNFRFGRRGGPLKEGTKTIFPVSIAEAEKAFSALENEKRKKGYASASESPIDVEFVREKPNLNEKRRKAVVKALRLSVNGEEPENWKVSRIIWRAGELNIEEAESYILKLADTSDVFTIYSSVWSLSRCGGAKSIPFLQKTKEDKSLPSFVSNLITDSLLCLLPKEEKEKLLVHELNQLPVPLKESLEAKEYLKFRQILSDYLLNLKISSNRYIVSLYRLSFDDLRLKEIFLDILNQLPFKPGTFRYLRQLFKIAEMRCDYGAYAVLAKNVEKYPSGFKSSYGLSYINGRNLKLVDEVTKEDSSLAFSNKTKEYLTRRTLRTLFKTSKIQEGYTELACSLLLAYQDKFDKSEPSFSENYTYNSVSRNYESTKSHYDAYANYMVFNQILYKQSTRYRKLTTKWECIPPFEPGKSSPKEREEAFPQLWNKSPEQIIRLLSESKAAKVQEFAYKVYKANPDFVKLVETKHVKAFLISGYADTAQLGYEMALKIYNPSAPDKNIVLALLESGIPEAILTAQKWVNDQREFFLKDTEFLMALILSRQPEVVSITREWLMAFPVKGSQGKDVVNNILALLLNAKEYLPEENQVNGIAEIFILGFEEAVRDLNLQVLQTLITRPEAALQSLGARLLLKNKCKAENIPETFLLSLISSDNQIVRGIAMEMIGQLSNGRLIEKKNLLISLLVSPLADMRNNVMPVLEKLIKADAGFARELSELLIPILLMNESYEGVHEDIRKMLTGILFDQLSYLDKKKQLALCNSRNTQAQLLGCQLLKATIKPDDLSITELLKLAANPQMIMREYCWSIFSTQKERIKKEKELAIKLCDNYWEDTRRFAFDYFAKNFNEEDWTSEVLVSLCDSIKQDVQAYGRQMITKSFQSADGEYYLMSLCQHPENKMQLFATNYLEKYAGGKPEQIEKLESFFIALLSQVNKGRVSKTRVLNFLSKESTKDERSAIVVARIINRTSASISIQDKAICVAVLLELSKRHPSIQTVIKIKEVEQR